MTMSMYSSYTPDDFILEEDIFGVQFSLIFLSMNILYIIIVSATYINLKFQ